MSNDEIYYRTISSLEEGSYDFVVIMWSSLNRRWEYVEDNNIDDFTIINGVPPSGFMSDNPLVVDYAKLYYTLFNNRYINLKRWLINIISLTSYFKTKGIPYLFIKGFDNATIDFQKMHYDPVTGFHNTTTQLEKIMDFDNRPDSYLNQKINIIKQLINQVEKFNWVNFEELAFFTSAVDLADDGEHPGIESNKMIFNQIVNWVENTQLKIF